MTWTTRLHRRACVVAPLLLLLVAGGSTGCGDPGDPTAILDSELNNPEGAELLRRDVLFTLYGSAAHGAWYSGLLADEFLNQPSVSQELAGVRSVDELLDRRETQLVQEGSSAIFSYGQWQELRMRKVPAALAKLRAYAPAGAREAHMGEMFALRGYAAVRLAEDFCPGFPLHDVVDYKVIYGPPRSTEQVFDYAIAAFDSALSWAADSARVLNFARLGRARTLLNLGRFADAAAAVVDVPTGYVYQTEYSATVGGISNLLASEPGWPAGSAWGDYRSVADRESGNGLNFVSAQDPRVLTIQRGTARNGQIRLYGIGKYPSRTTPIVLANGVEARLIEAEAALKGNPGDGTWLTLLNALRTNGTYTTRRNAQDTTKTDTLWNAGTGNVPGLNPLTDPGTETARVDLLFRERAFWLFATGHRLGDLRRLVRQYARTSESVLPTGTYWRGGVYRTGTSLPFDRSEVQFSPGVTGCTSW